MGQHILALQIDGDHIRAALADRTIKSLDLLAVHEETRAGDETDLSGALARILAATGRPDVTISAMPGEFVANRLLTLPFTDRRRLEQVVPFALEEHLPFAVDDAAVAFARLGRLGSSTLVIAAFARKVELERHLATLGQAGLDPKVVTLGALALSGLLARTRNGQAIAQLVVAIEDASTSMVLIDEAGTPRAMRTVGQSFNAGNGALAPAGSHNAILAAVRQTLLAHSGENKAPELVLAGSHAPAAGIRDQLASALEVRVRDFSEFDCSALIQGTRPDTDRFAGCLAMLLGEAPVAPLELLNFRQGAFAFRGAKGALLPLRTTGLLAAAALAVAMLHVILAMAVSAKQLHLLNREIEAVTTPVIGNVPAATARADLQAKIADIDKRLRLFGGNLGHGSPLDVLLDLSRAVPPSVSLEVDTVQIDESGLKVEGSADSFASVDQIKRQLERTAYFDEIQVDRAGAGSDNGRVEFHLSAKLKDAGGP